MINRMYSKTKILHVNHWKFEDFKQRITTRCWKMLLLNNDDNLIFNGVVRRLIAKKLGYGVVEISKEVTYESIQQKRETG